MRKVIIGFIVLMLALWTGAAAAEDSGILGKPFPDFSATDTQGNTFTLSEALKDHEAVLINLWATWCPPCEAEFPDLNEVYMQYGDRVAFISLSCEETDTLDKIEDYRQAHGIAFPMGRDEGGKLFTYSGSSGIPVTMIVDRFGNTAFEQTGMFQSADEVTRVLDAVLENSHTETQVLDEIPADASTRAFPVSAKRAMHVENENAKPVLFHVSGYDTPLTFYVVPDKTARLRMEITAAEQPDKMVYSEGYQGETIQLSQLLDSGKNAYVFDQPMPGEEQGIHYIYICLVNTLISDDPDIVESYLITDGEYVEECAEAIRSLGYEVTWEYGEPAQKDDSSLQAYILHAADQYGAPVAGVMVNFCTDTACSMAESDENGTITFDGKPDVYHVQLLEVPDGYSFDEDFELYTGNEYGEWVLRIRKD